MKAIQILINGKLPNHLDSNFVSNRIIVETDGATYNIYNRDNNYPELNIDELIALKKYNDFSQSQELNNFYNTEDEIMQRIELLAAIEFSNLPIKTKNELAKCVADENYGWIEEILIFIIEASYDIEVDAIIAKLPQNRKVNEI